jgi:hypothetical protein
VKLRSVRHIAATFDGWSGLANKRFVSLTLHFLDNEWRFQEMWAACSYLPGFVGFDSFLRLSHCEATVCFSRVESNLSWRSTLDFCELC